MRFLCHAAPRFAAAMLPPCCCRYFRQLIFRCRFDCFRRHAMPPLPPATAGHAAAAETCLIYAIEFQQPPLRRAAFRFRLFIDVSPRTAYC